MVRLAHEQGILHQRELNHFQSFALLYWIYLDRRVFNETSREQLELQCFNLFPERWEAVYLNQEGSVLSPPPDEDEDIPVDSIDELEKFYATLDQPRMASGADDYDLGRSGLPAVDDQDWGAWQ